MTHTIELDDIGITLEIKNPLSVEEWVKALDEHCEKVAENNHCHKYYRYGHHEPGEEEMEGLCEAVINAIAQYRSMVSAEQASFEDWDNILAGAIYDKYDELGIDDDDHQYDALHNSDFEDLYIALDLAMSEIDGPVCDIEVLWDELRDITISKMYDKDDSTIYDLVNQTELTLSHTPGIKEDDHNRSDFMFYDVLSNGPDENLVRLLDLYRLPGMSLIDAMTERQANDHRGEILIDYLDDDKLDEWGKIMGVTYDLPALCDADEVLDIIENGSTYQLPMWCGIMSIQDIRKIDFSEPVYIKGGLIGGVDFINGAGQVSCMQGVMVLGEDESFSMERGYTVKSIFDYANDDMAADLTNIRPKELSLTKEVSSPQMSMAL